tara:strand:- start:233 stop:433 length:201 start_codon:yes stop_codon:yes gene_type:complete
MKKSLFALIAVCFLGTGCSYTAVTRLGKGKVAVVKNDNFLMGALRKVFVCNATKGGLSNCSTNENP